MDSIVISDLHLSDADTGRTDKPFWKHKRKNISLTMTSFG